MIPENLTFCFVTFIHQVWFEHPTWVWNKDLEGALTWTFNGYSVKFLIKVLKEVSLYNVLFLFHLNQWPPRRLICQGDLIAHVAGEVITKLRICSVCWMAYWTDLLYLWSLKCSYQVWGSFWKSKWPGAGEPHWSSRWSYTPRAITRPLCAHTSWWYPAQCFWNHTS